ncbi:MAG: hypothetical protein ACRDN0_37600 [Trebonia sp.]
MSQRDDSGASHETPENFGPSYGNGAYQPSPGPRAAGFPDPGSLAPGSPDPAPEPLAQAGGEWTHDERRQRPQPENQRVWPDESWPPRQQTKRKQTKRRQTKRQRPAWVVPAITAVVSAAVAVALVLGLDGGIGNPAPAKSTTPSSALARHTASPKATTPSVLPPITTAGATTVVHDYFATVNAADAAFSATMLGRADGQGSYSLIAGLYRQDLASRAKPTAAYGPRSAQYYIPLESAAYPHWFAIRVANATTGKKPRGLGAQYLVFVQAAADASWKEVDQPYILGTAPDVALDAAGYATAVSSTAAGFAVAPSRIAAVTARTADGHGRFPFPGNLRDAGDAAAWRRSLPKGTAVSLARAATADPVYGLETTGGGALLFYSDVARLSATPAKHKTLKLSVPGYYTSKQRLKSASLTFVDQFAAYDPPATIPGLSVIADYSGIVS